MTLGTLLIDLGQTGGANHLFLILIMFIICLSGGITSYFILKTILTQRGTKKLVKGGAAATASWARDSFTSFTEQIEKQLPGDRKLNPIYLAIALLVFITGSILFQNIIPALLLTVLLVITPSQIARKRQQMYQTKVQEQLSRAIRIFASEFSVTPQVERGFAVVAKSVEEPVGGIFRNAYNQMIYRYDFDTVLSEMAAKLNTPHGHIFVQLLRATKTHSRTITPLFYELVSKIATSQDMNKKNTGETSGEKILSMIMAFSPLPIYLFLNKITPDTTIFLTETILGRFVVATCFASAILWIVMDYYMGGTRYDRIS